MSQRSAGRSVLPMAFMSMALAGMSFSATARADDGDDLEGMRQQLEQQWAQIQAQKQLLEQQGRAIEELSRRLEGMSEAEQPSDRPLAAVALDATPGPTPTRTAPDTDVRDPVGDLNSGSVAAGDFPGSFKIPGTRNVSLAIGGFAKAAAIADSAAEGTGAAFTPAYLGTRLPDEQGGFSIDSSLSRLFLDGRAPAGDGSVRAYFEWDLNQAGNGSLGFNLRHAYGAWTNGHGTLTAGHTWSTLMDLKILPEGLTEPTVSGPIFNRQSQIRWSQKLGPSVTFHAAVEDPSSSDVLDPTGSPTSASTSVPDVIVGIERDWSSEAHVRLNGIWRRLDIGLPSGDRVGENAWGVSLSGHVTVGERDRWAVSSAYGEGLGRYLLGIQSTAGSAIDLASEEIDLRRNFGVMTAYKHYWSDVLRSNVMLGYAKADPLSWQPADTFESTGYAAVNLMWQVLPYITFGVEYGYGLRKDQDGSELDNHRVSLGFQIY